MSKLDTIEVRCPSCGIPSVHNAWASVNVNVSPELKLQLLERKLNLFTCRACGFPFYCEFDLLYNDMGKKLMVWLRPDNSQPDDGEALSILDTLGQVRRYRLVTSFNDLIEKILIAEDSLDDRIIEIIKLSLWRQKFEDGQHPSGVYYGGLLHPRDEAKQIEFMLFKGDEEHGCSIPYRESYGRVEQAMRDQWHRIQWPSRWNTVDRGFAEDLERLL